MTFAEVLPALRDGRKARRPIWPAGRWTQRHGAALLEVWDSERRSPCCAVDFEDLTASDWELVEEPAKPCGSCEQRKADWEIAHANNDELRATIALLERELTDLRADLVGGHHPKCARAPHSCGSLCCARGVKDAETIARLDGEVIALNNSLGVCQMAFKQAQQDEARLTRELAEATAVCMSGWGCILRPCHAGQCRDLEGNSHGTPSAARRIAIPPGG